MSKAQCRLSLQFKARFLVVCQVCRPCLSCCVHVLASAGLIRTLKTSPAFIHVAVEASLHTRPAKTTLIQIEAEGNQKNKHRTHRYVRGDGNTSR